MNAMTPIVAAEAAPALPATWAEAKAVYLAARTAEETFDSEIAHRVWASVEGDTALFDGPITGESDRLTDVRSAAEDHLMLRVPSPTAAEVAWKVAHARQRWSDFEDWSEEWWSAVLSDLRRLSADPHMLMLAERDRLLRLANRTPGISDEEASSLGARADAMEAAIFALPASTRDGVLAKCLLLVGRRALAPEAQEVDVFREASALGMIEFMA